MVKFTAAIGFGEVLEADSLASLLLMMSLKGVSHHEATPFVYDDNVENAPGDYRLVRHYVTPQMAENILANMSLRPTMALHQSEYPVDPSLVEQTVYFLEGLMLRVEPAPQTRVLPLLEVEYA